MILVTRPRADAESFAKALEKKGREAFCEPMFEIVSIPNSLPVLTSYDALAFTSRHAVSAFATRESTRHLPVYAVGGATADAARSFGFQDVREGGGTLDNLNRLLRKEAANRPGSVLHISGAHVTGAVEQAGGGVADRVVLYEARPVQILSPDFLDVLERGGLQTATFFSARTAEIFCGLVEQYARTPALSSIKALCLSAPVVESLRHLSWKDVQTAGTPDMAGMLARL